MATREKEVEHMISTEEKSEALSKKEREEPQQPIVVILSWHRAYGEALLYAQSDRAATLISKAEQRIFERYLEVAASSSSLSPEEDRDLWNAVTALSELKLGSRAPSRHPLAYSGVTTREGLVSQTAGRPFYESLSEKSAPSLPKLWKYDL